MNNMTPLTQDELQQTLTLIQQQVDENPVVLYMKGSPDEPQCGFSARATHIIRACGADNFFHVDVLAENQFRQALPKFSNWPTFPQLYIKGKLIGGSDILFEMYQNGELQTLIQQSIQEDT